MTNKPSLKDHRFRIMEGVLAWEGKIGNARVRQLFGLQPVQASRLLADFRAYMGDQLVEDSRTKVWRPADHGRLVPELTLVEYARLVETPDESCIVDARVDLTDIRPTLFAALRKAAVTSTGITISYASMTTPEFHERTIYPHSIVHVGRRWHVRAWCAKRQEFRDFTLGRIRDAVLTQMPSPTMKKADDAWNQIVDIELAAHHKLDAPRQSVVQMEYFGGAKSRHIPCRACLTQYLIQELRAATNPDVEVPPEFQIEVMNVPALQNALFEPLVSRDRESKSETEIIVRVEAGYVPPDGDAFDAVRDALDYFEIPASLVECPTR